MDHDNEGKCYYYENDEDNENAPIKKRPDQCLCSILSDVFPHLHQFIHGLFYS